MDMKYIGFALSVALGATFCAADAANGVQVAPRMARWHLDKSRHVETGLTVTSLEDLSRSPRDEVTRLYLRGAKKSPVGGLYGLTGLAELDLSENGLAEVPASVFAMASLRRLWLADNPIEKLSPDIARLKALVYLNLDRTSLAAVPDAVGELTELRYLRLNDTSVASLPESMGKLPHMRRLYARNTKLKEVPQVLASWRALEDVVFDGTEIAAVPDWLVALPKLKRVSFAGCGSLARLPADLRGWRTLQVLNVSDTPLAGNADERRRVRSALGDGVTILF
jgi:hypothetical protein